MWKQHPCDCLFPQTFFHFDYWDCFTIRCCWYNNILSILISWSSSIYCERSDPFRVQSGQGFLNFPAPNANSIPALEKSLRLHVWIPRLFLFTYSPCYESSVKSMRPINKNNTWAWWILSVLYYTELPSRITYGGDDERLQSRKITQAHVYGFCNVYI